MPNNTLTTRLQQAKETKTKCLMPYITAGYPDLETTAKLIRRMDAAGCQAIEIGFPFSDSIADGPVIQESFYDALDAQFHVDTLFRKVAELSTSVSAALLAMVSMSIVRRRGAERFVKQAAQAGFSGLIVPDVPIDECDDLARMAESNNICNILMAAPTSTDERLGSIAGKSSGFVYVISSRGITGERKNVCDGLRNHIERIRGCCNLPLIVGFGISTAEQVRSVCQVADGVIVGSAVIRRIGAAADEHQDSHQIAETVGEYVDELMLATRADA